MRREPDDLNPDYADRFAGCLAGLAVGEQLGRLGQGLTRAGLARRYPGRLQDFPAGAADGPQTLLAALLARGLAATGGQFQPHDLSSRLTAVLARPAAAGFDPLTISQIQSLAARPAGWPEPPGDPRPAVRLAVIGLLHAYGPDAPPRFAQDCEAAVRLTHSHPQAIAGAVAAATAVRLLARHDIMPEDLMAAALDVQPPGYLGLPLAGNPLRQKLLAAQDYIEERQTLLDNVEAGDLAVDFFRIDLNNLERCGTGDYAPDLVAGAFYAFAARKTSFEEAVTLAANAGGETATLAALTGALAGAYHGLAAIPARWRVALSSLDELVEVAGTLHRAARNRV